MNTERLWVCFGFQLASIFVVFFKVHTDTVHPAKMTSNGRLFSSVLGLGQTIFEIWTVLYWGLDADLADLTVVMTVGPMMCKLINFSHGAATVFNY